MKKATVFLILLAIFLPLKSVLAVSPNAPVGSDISYNTCVNFQDSRITASGDGYFGHCIQATCYTGVWKKAYYISQDLVRCSNGNTNFYSQITSDGCGSNYNGSCTATPTAKYCNLITYYDCNKTADGKPFITSTTTKPTTTIKIPTTKPTTSPKTTKPPKTTTTKPTPTKPTTEPPTEEPKNNNNYLSSLLFSKGKIKFNREILDYTLELEEGITSVDVKAIPEESTSLVTIENNTELSLENPIKITVTAESSDVRVYTVAIKYILPDLDSNNLLESLKITGYKLKFEPAKFNYIVKIKSKQTSLDINLKPQSTKATTEITGNENLKANSMVNIKVTAENGSVQDYTLTIKASANYGLIIVIFIVLGIAIYVGYKIIVKLKTKEQKDGLSYEYE